MQRYQVECSFEWYFHTTYNHQQKKFEGQITSDQTLYSLYKKNERKTCSES